MFYDWWPWPSNAAVTRCSKNWLANKPGGWDVLNTRRIFPSSNYLGIPDLAISEGIDLNNMQLVPFHLKQYGFNNICHFFLDDYHFERVWNRPSVYINMLKKYHAVLTPDFSLYTDYPMTLNIYNTYRNRWLGCFWQEHGIKVIPTICWAGFDSFYFSFMGIPLNSIVALSPPDLRNPNIKKLFYAGLNAAINSLKPRYIISYGRFDFPADNILFFDKFSICQ